MNAKPIRARRTPREEEIDIPFSTDDIAKMIRIPGVAVVIVLAVIHMVLWSAASILQVFKNLGATIMLFLACFAGAIVHEALHGAGFALFGRVPWSATGYGWSRMTAFAHCRVPIVAGAYRASIALPGLVLGVLPVLLGLGLGISYLTLFGAFMTASAMADLRLLLALRRVPASARIIYRPDKSGYEVLES